MDLEISGRVALVSGGSRGLGLATAQRLAEEGVRVVIAARTQPALDEALASMQERGGSVVGVAAEMATAGGVARAVESARSTFGAPDIAIANVHSPTDGDFFEVEEEDFHAAFQGLTISIALLARAVLPAMKAQGWGEAAPSRRRSSTGSRPSRASTGSGPSRPGARRCRCDVRGARRRWLGSVPSCARSGRAT